MTDSLPCYTSVLVDDDLQLASYLIVDVREPSEHHSRPSPAGAISLPLSELREDPIATLAACSQLSKAKPILCVCKGGVRSALAAEILHAHGVGPLYNLEGGLLAYDAFSHDA